MSADGSTCDHSAATLPDPLPRLLTAALQVRDDPARGLPFSRVLERLKWAIVVLRYTDNSNGFPAGDDEGWYSPGRVCAALRLHTTLATAADRASPGLLCGISRKLDLLDLPALTQVGLAERTAIMFSGDLAWSPDGFRLWDGTRWATDDGDALAAGCVKHVVRVLLPAEAKTAAEDARILAKADAPTDDAEKKEHDVKVAAAAKAAGAAAAYTAKSASSAAVHAALDLIRDEPGIHVPVADWDANERALTVANGTLELADGGAKLREHRRADRITRTARAAWRPDQARGEFARFIEKAIPDAPVRAYLQRLLGYALLGHNAERVLLLIVGATSSGKSTLLEAIAHALGEYASTFELTLFRSSGEPGKPRTDLHDALPRRVLITTETSARWSLDADAVKRLTGNDTGAARTLHSRVYRQQRPAFVPIIAANAAPQIRGADKALWRRARAVPMDQTVAEGAEDVGLGARLRDDADGVLAWLVEGFDAYVQMGGFGEVPEVCRDALTKIKADVSLLDRWIAERCEPGEFKVTNAELKEDYWAWCAAHRVAPADQLNGIALGRALAERGFAEEWATGPEGKRGRGRSGLRLHPDRSSLDGGAHERGCRCPTCARVEAYRAQAAR